MKENRIANIENVKKSIQMIRYLRERPKTEMVGLGLIYGAPGLGKSRFARRFAIRNGLFYLRLEATDTARTFSIKLYEILCEKYNISEQIRGSTNKIFDACIDIINDVNDEVIIFIDEIDYAFHRNRKLLGSIRDIVDRTLAIIILVGMQNAKQMLLRADSHYFDRCNYFTEFKPISLADASLICKTIADVDIDSEVVKYIHSAAAGNLRKMIKLIYAIESVASGKSLKKIGIKDIEGAI